MGLSRIASLMLPLHRHARQNSFPPRLVLTDVGRSALTLSVETRGGSTAAMSATRLEVIPDSSMGMGSQEATV